MIEKLLRAGVDLFRINYSHQDHASHERRAVQIRDVSKRLGTEVGIIADLQGPKIRIERFRGGSITLQEGDNFILDGSLIAVFIATVAIPSFLFSLKGIRAARKLP